jgi:hypothetical protein
MKNEGSDFLSFMVPTILGNLGWYQMALGNLVAAASMGT